MSLDIDVLLYNESKNAFRDVKNDNDRYPD